MDTKKVTEVREKTGVGVMEAKTALEACDWDVEQAVSKIISWGRDRPVKPSGHMAVFTYNHSNRIASMVAVGCNTDFTGRTAEFHNLGNKLAQQIAAMNPQSVEDLLEQEDIRNPHLKVKDLLEEVQRQTQETVTIFRFHRMEA